jgi:uncharacterized protein YbbK (DUF523 family)
MLVIGISACLLGEPVRYDGGDKKNPLLSALADKQVRYIPICPEAGCGLGVPREPMRLEGNPHSPRLLTIESRRDKTGILTQWCENRLFFLQQQNPAGFIFKNRSPSCGLSGVQVTTSPSHTTTGIGLFAQQIKASLPTLPMAEGDDLNSSATIEHFLELVAAFASENYASKGTDHG